MTGFLLAAINLRTVAFEDGPVVMARIGHPALRQRHIRKVLEASEFEGLRPRIEGDSPVPALREWQRLRPRVALEVSEIVEVFMVAGQSDLLALALRSMEKVARGTFDLRVLPATPKLPTMPIKLIWSARLDGDPAHSFLRGQLLACVKQVIQSSDPLVPNGGGERPYTCAFTVRRG